MSIKGSIRITTLNSDNFSCTVRMFEDAYGYTVYGVKTFSDIDGTLVVAVVVASLDDALRIGQEQLIDAEYNLQLSRRV